MNETTRKIVSRGYWRVKVRPDQYVNRRVESVTDLVPLLETLSVRARGWDFPHVENPSSTSIGDCWAEQSIDWETRLERWRIYQSGQFVYLGAFRLDWAEDVGWWGPRPPVEPGTAYLGVADAVFRFVEFFEFAAALALSNVGDDPMVISIGCHHLSGRRLWIDAPNRVPFRTPPQSRIPEYVQERSLSRQELVGETRTLAIGWAKELMRRFNWDPSDATLEGLVARIT